MVVADKILDGSNDAYDFYDITRKKTHKHKVIESSDEDDVQSENETDAKKTLNTSPLQLGILPPVLKEKTYNPKAKAINKVKVSNRETDKIELHSKTQEIIRHSRVNFPYEKGPKLTIAQIRNGEIDRLISDENKVVKSNKIRDLLILNSPSIELAIFNDLNIFDKADTFHNKPAPILNLDHTKDCDLILEPSPEIPYVKINKKGHTHEYEHTILENFNDNNNSNKEDKISKRKLDFSSYFSKNKLHQDENDEDNFDLMSMKSLTSLVSLDSHPSKPCVNSISNQKIIKPSLAKCEITNPNGCIEFEIELATNEKDVKINQGVNTLVNRFVKHAKYKTPDIKRKDNQSPKSEIKLDLVQNGKINKGNSQFPQCKGMKLEMLQKSLLPMMLRKRQENFERRVQAYHKYKVIEEEKFGINEGSDDESESSNLDMDTDSIKDDKGDENEVKGKIEVIEDPFTRKCTDDFSYGEGSFSSNKVVSAYTMERTQSSKDLFATNPTFPPNHMIGLNNFEKTNFDENTSYFQNENRFVSYQEDSMELPGINLNPFKNQPKNSSSSHDLFDGFPNQSSKFDCNTSITNRGGWEDDSVLGAELMTPSGPSQDVFAIPETALFGINEEMDGLEEAKFLCSGTFPTQRFNEDISIRSQTSLLFAHGSNDKNDDQPKFGFDNSLEDESQMSLVEKETENRNISSQMDSVLVEERDFSKEEDSVESWDGLDKKKKGVIKIVESDEEEPTNYLEHDLENTNRRDDSEHSSEEEEGDIEGDSQAESEGEIEGEDEELKEFYSQEKLKKNDYIEDEAELSGEDVGVNDENEEGEDDYEIDDEAEALGIEETELNEQVGKIHRKVTLEQDKKEIRALQEIFFDEGEDPANQTQRIRRFKWNFDDENSASSFTRRNTRFSSPEPDQNSSEADDKNDRSADQSPDTEVSRRRLRFERSQFMDSLQRQDSEALFLEKTHLEGDNDLKLEDSDFKEKILEKPFSSLFPPDLIAPDTMENDVLGDCEDIVIRSQVRTYQSKVTSFISKSRAVNMYNFLKNSEDSSSMSTSYNSLFRKISPKEIKNKKAAASHSNATSKRYKTNESPKIESKSKILKNSIFNYF